MTRYLTSDYVDWLNTKLKEHNVQVRTWKKSYQKPDLKELKTYIHLAEDYRYSTNGKVRFYCKRCNNRWTSAKGLHHFEYTMYQRGETLYLYLEVYVYSQQCQGCKNYGMLHPYL